MKFASPLKSKTAPWKAAPAAPVKKIIPPPAKNVEGKTGSPLPAAVAKSRKRGTRRTRPASEIKPEVKTFSDAEILASVKPDPSAKPGIKVCFSSRSPRRWPRQKPQSQTARRPPTRRACWISVGEEKGVVPIDIVNSVAGETGLPGKVVGNVDVRERHSFVDVASEHANAIIAKLNRAEIKGHKVKVKVA